MDVRHQHGTNVHQLKACYNDDASDLIAVGGDHSVEVLKIGESTYEIVATFHIGTRITALTWSPKTISPGVSDEWVVELVAATQNFGLHLLTKTAATDEVIFPFGGGLSGHHGRVNDMSFCGGTGEDSARYVATVSDDKMLMVWDLHPSLDISSPSALGAGGAAASPPARPQPTAYVISFPHPLTSVSAHPSTSKEFLVADSHGSIFLTDWRSDPDAVDAPQQRWRHSSVLELVEPRAMADALAGLSTQRTGSVAWRRDGVDLVGATYGSTFSLWDLSKLQGGKPFATGPSFPDGGHRFRWCQTYPEYFAISALSASKGAAIHVYSAAHAHAPPTAFALAPRPLRVRDFDFLGHRGRGRAGIPRIAAAVGREVVVFAIGVE